MDTFLCERLKTPEEKREEKGQREREREEFHRGSRKKLKGLIGYLRRPCME